MASSKSDGHEARGYAGLTLQQAKMIIETKIEMEGLLDEGFVTEETKEKLRECARKRPDLFGCWEDI